MTDNGSVGSFSNDETVPVNEVEGNESKNLRYSLVIKELGNKLPKERNETGDETMPKQKDLPVHDRFTVNLTDTLPNTEGTPLFKMGPIPIEPGDDTSSEVGETTILFGNGDGASPKTKHTPNKERFNSDKIKRYITYLTPNRKPKPSPAVAVRYLPNAQGEPSITAEHSFSNPPEEGNVTSYDCWDAPNKASFGKLSGVSLKRRSIRYHLDEDRSDKRADKLLCVGWILIIVGLFLSILGFIGVSYSMKS